MNAEEQKAQKECLLSLEKILASEWVKRCHPLTITLCKALVCKVGSFTEHNLAYVSSINQIMVDREVAAKMRSMEPKPLQKIRKLEGGYHG